MNFMFSWQEQYLTRSLRSLVRYCSCYSNIKFISSRHRVISSIYFTNSIFVYLIVTLCSIFIPTCQVFKEQDFSRSDPAQQVAESILRFFPGFQAFKLPPPTVDDEVLQNINRNKDRLNPKFLEGIDQFKRLLWSTLVPKQGPNDGEVVTGEGMILNWFQL